MSDSNDDFLTTRLGDIVTIENSDMDSQEEATPWKCWGRGGTRPSLSKLNLQRFLEISARCKVSTVETEVKIKTSPKKSPTFPINRENIMESITSECHEVLGNPKTDKHIAEWLQHSFSEAVERQNNAKQHKETFHESLSKDSAQLRSNDTDQDIVCRTGDINNDILYKSNQNNNTKVEEKSAGSHLFLLKPKTTDQQYSDMLCQMPSNKLFSSVDKQGTNTFPSGLTHFSKNIVCVQNRSHSFTIENLPNNVTRNDLDQILSIYGTVENILIRESEGNVTANIRMDANSNCEWVIKSLNEDQPFGESNT